LGNDLHFVAFGGDIHLFFHELCDFVRRRVPELAQRSVS
jgi:hypothetical protein